MNIECEKADNGWMRLSDRSREFVRSLDPWSRHSVYHRFCQQCYRDAKGRSDEIASSPLAEQGLQFLPDLLAPQDVAEAREMLEDFLAGSDVRPEGVMNPSVSLPWSQIRIYAMRQMLERLFSPVFCRLLEDYFGSYFRLLSVSVARTYPDEQSKVSFLWHRDIEPAQQTHLMIYLTDTSPESGGTSFLNLEDTRAMAENGYGFRSAEDRVGSFDDISANLDKDIRIHRPSLKAGSGVVFPAPRILHRGNLPVTGYRDTMLILMMPSPIPWSECLAADPRRPFVVQHPGTGDLEPFEGERLDIGPNRLPPTWATLGELFPPEHDTLS